jgi:multiple sugar transport system ATP-binding protein
MSIRPSNVSVRGLDISFGPVHVLKNLNIEVGQSEFLVLLGPSGCGKSTLLNAIAGLMDVSKGQIWIGGDNVTWSEPKDRGIAMVFQSYALYPHMTVRNNLSFGLKVAGAATEEIERRVGVAADMLRLKELLERKPAHLSGGQRQRVAIGRALVREAPVFLFDEPLSNLDAQLRAELRVEIKRLHQRIGATMIYVTHDQIEALTLADRIAVMQGGIIQQLDTPQNVYSKPANRFVAAFVGSPAMNFVDGKLVLDAGRPLLDLGGVKVPVDGYEFSSPPIDGQAVTLGIRPEHLEIQTQSQNQTDRAQGLASAVEMIEPMGAESLVWSRLGAAAVSARISSERSMQLNEAISLHLPVRRMSLFDTASGNRI